MQILVSLLLMEVVCRAVWKSWKTDGELEMARMLYGLYSDQLTIFKEEQWNRAMGSVRFDVDHEKPGQSHCWRS